MSIKTFFHNFHYKKRYSICEKLLFVILYPISMVYLFVAYIRNKLYSKGILNSYHPGKGVKIISIGNLTTGGTGKTPTVEAMVRYLKNNSDYKIAIISRGYGKLKPDNTTIVRTEKELLVTSAHQAGDEALMLANTIEDITIISGSNRIASAKIAIEKYNCNLLILDDGFQHRKIKRDLDIVLIDNEKLLGNKHILPLGPLREPVSYISRADAVILTSKNINSLNNSGIISFINNHKLVDFKGVYEFDCFVEILTNKSFEDIKQRNVLIFCGIGQPESFVNNLTSKGYKIEKSIIYSDHFKYTEKDAECINENALSFNADVIITTEKDTVKILPFISKFKLPVYTLKMKMTIDFKALLEKTNFYENNT